ncbi:MarR family winged helix-turn-helix transcriptional regulator [Nocardia sp. NPDC058058]|uniref:MarR family winged helix-turn-helix transcriptional regulator n=1 Tax=Nocardia sp. NPDC058058 TaxID=3346317 RepID=UPI0036DEB055
MGKRASSDPDRVGVELRLLVGQLFRELRNDMTVSGLSVPELSVLGRLDREGSVTAVELAAAEQVTPQAIALTVASLFERGLISKTKDQRDKRRLLLEPTPAGRTAMNAMRTGGADRVVKALEMEFTAAEVDKIADVLPLLGRLRDRL